MALGEEALLPPPPLDKTPLAPIYAVIVSAGESYAVETMAREELCHLWIHAKAAECSYGVSAWQTIRYWSRYWMSGRGDCDKLHSLVELLRHCRGSQIVRPNGLVM